MSELAWIVTRSSLPPVLKEVLYELIESIDKEIVGQLDKMEENFRERIEAVESSLNDEATQGELLNVWDLKEGMDDEIGGLERRITALEESEDTDDNSLLETLEDEALPLEIKLVKEIELVRRETCPFCGGKFEAGK